MDGHRKFVAKLANDNRRFYGTPDGQGVLKVMDLAFEHRWAYLYEIVQNALDVGARSIAIRTGEGGDALIIQHNGDGPLDERDVAGLSKVFRSTKGARSVGFMGIGFKSVFLRFHEVRVSDRDWRFRYEITQEVGEQFGDVWKDLLGTVIPIWDDEISLPDNGYTTRFELRQRIDGRTAIESDLERFLPEDDRASLAILAMSGLERLEIDGRTWELGVVQDRDGSCEATALSETETRLWRVFPAQFQPSRAAVACFLEHRKINPREGERKRVYDDAARPRRVLGVLPLDENGIAAPPSRGRVYATLPTDVTLPFGLHVNADWLLSMSRNGLREIEDNAWQREIAGAIADVLVHFLEWSANAHAERDTARSAFSAIGEPSSEEGGLESLLAEETWRSRFRDKLQTAAVIPVWTKSADDLAFAKPGDVIVPPSQIAKAFANRPELMPATLLNGPVLMNEVLGKGALGLLRTAGLLTEMAPMELENSWKDGLEDWWIALAGDEGDRRKQLFRLWAAVAELSDDDAWTNLNIRCVRSVTGAWLDVSEATFLNEALASEDEPGGQQTRRLMDQVVEDATRLDSTWVAALRQRRRQEADFPNLFRAWTWIEDNARSITLSEVVADALATQISAAPDGSVFTSFGHWARHRGDRRDLLPYVLVRSNGEAQVSPTKEALLADPYMESGHNRQRLWPGVPVIDGAYLETDPSGAGAHEWRTFFEKSGAKGRLEVAFSKRTAGRWEPERVAEFLGEGSDSITEANDGGYSLLDFDIKPELPAQDSSPELRAAVGPLLEDGFSELEGNGRRKASWHYYGQKERTGTKPSVWVEKLCELPWVPCVDGELRRPRDVLKEPDPARELAPHASLSSRLSEVLEHEGVEFGTAVPEASSLHRLSSAGSGLEAKELAELLADCREQATSDRDRHLFSQALGSLMLPTTENRRVLLGKVVQRVGGRLRGPLGGWVVPLDQFEASLRAELEHEGFPDRFPGTTTGEQALDYIVHVWARARSSPEGLANEVRDVLPAAYGYVLEDAGKDAAFLELWQERAPQAMVFSGREWIALNEVEDVYFDDIEDRRFLPKQVHFRTVTAGHLGRTRDEQIRAAKAIRLPLLSSVVKLNWIGGDNVSSASNAWERRFDLICDLLRSAKGSEPSESGEPDAKTSVRLIHAKEVALEVSVGSGPPEQVPVHARLDAETLTVAGRPAQFGADAAKELLRLFSFGQRAGLAADLTGMFVAIENGDFRMTVEKFRRSHAPEHAGAIDEPAEIADPEADSGSVDEDVALIEEPEESKVAIIEETTSAAIKQVDHGSSDSETDGGRHDEHLDGPKEEHDEPDGGRFGKDRALAQQNALARLLKKSLKGEILPDLDEGEQVEPVATNGGIGSGLGDEDYREVVVRYEREAGRKPEPGDPHQSGWDVRSTDPQTGECRLIEVKGRGRPWEADEVVELSSAQVRKAFEENERWYLYVVEKVDANGYRVLPIANPVHGAAKWILCGESWRMVAEDTRVLGNTPD